MKNFLVILCTLLAVMNVASEDETPVFLCGRQLATARVYLCYGAEYVSKKSSQLPNYLVSDDEKWHDWPWLGRRGALTASWSRYKRDEGLADLCCLKPCTTDVILKYC